MNTQIVQKTNNDILLLEKITALLVKYASLDFSSRLTVSGEDDVLDAVMVGLNTLGEELQAYHKQRDPDRQARVEETLVKFASLDFSSRLPISEKGDELDAISAGLNALAEEIQSSGRAVREYEQRVNGLMEILLQYTMMDFSKRAPMSDVGDEIDAIALGLNTLAEELQASKEIEKIQQAKLRENEERYRLIVESARDYAIIMLDKEGYIQSWNTGAENVKGYKAEEIVGKHMSVFYTPEELAAGEPEENLKLAKLKGSFEREGWRLKKDGTRFMADVVFTPMYDSQGELKGFSKVTRDITERKRNQDKILRLNSDLEKNIHKLEVVNKELESFSYSVSHDLRTPLRAIHSYTKILSTEYIAALDDEAKQMMEAVMYNAKRMGQLIDDLLAFSRIGKKELQKTSLDMTELVKLVSLELNSIMPESRAVFDIPILEEAFVDPGMMKLVWTNLISNALKYSSKKELPTIHFGSEKKEKDTVYWIKDNGAGFDMRYYNKLFGVFQRLHDAEEFDGTGVGLALVERIVTRHDGAIWAESAPGKVASFFFSLPNNS
jgi:PAS domain S-box-containing protein